MQSTITAAPPGPVALVAYLLVRGALQAAPAPRFAARSIVSLGMFASYVPLSIARRQPRVHGRIGTAQACGNRDLLDEAA